MALDYELELLGELVALDTDSVKKTNYVESANIIARRMRGLGMRVEVLDPKELVGDGIPRPNVIGTLDAGADATIGLVTHYDIVPPGDGWTKPPFKLTIEGGKAFGRGVADDKSAIAASLGAVKKVGKNARMNVKVIASPEEEIGGRWGIGYVMDHCKMRFDQGVVIDSMPNFISVGASGVVQGEIRAIGKQGHAGYPYLADNPVPKLMHILGEFEGFARQRERKLSAVDAPPGSPRKKVWGRISFTMLGGGEKENIIPGEAWARFDMRLLPEESSSVAIAEMEKFFEEATWKLGVEARLTFKEPHEAYLTDPSSSFVSRFSNATAAVFGSPLPIAASLGGDDGKFLQAKGIPVVSFGTIADDSHFHGVDEFVRLSDLENVRDVLVKLIG
jgi:succinyl-diaminopimelate desuccinylase